MIHCFFFVKKVFKGYDLKIITKKKITILNFHNLLNLFNQGLTGYENAKKKLKQRFLNQDPDHNL